jgi:hypothetical protein
MRNLLCDAEFTNIRTNLLGRNIIKQPEESLNGEADKALVLAIKGSREKERSYLSATVVHVKDIERFHALCEPISDGDETRDMFQGSDCIEALAMWRHKLLGLRNVEKKTLPEAERSEINNNSVFRANCASVAKTLLSKEDAWSANDTSEESSQSKKSSRSRKSSSKGIDQAKLAKALNVDIGHLKTELSIGRSILSLAKFTQRLSSKKSSRIAPSLLQEEVSFGLRDAIEVLSGISKTLQLILSEPFADLEEDDLDSSIKLSGGLPLSLCLQRLAVTRAECKPLLTLTGIFLAEAWFMLGRMSALLSTTKTHKDKLLMVACFDRSLLILSSPKEAPKNQLSEPLTKHKAFLQSNVNHAMGVCLYESGIFDRSGRCLADATALRRKLLDELRNQTSSSSDQTDGILSTFSKNVASYFFSSPQTVSKEVFSSMIEYSVSQCCALLPTKITEKSEADDLELSLSLTLEYAALTNHANQSYQTALASFQEALILRSLHVGKNSLDIASLHFNTGKSVLHLE